MEVPLSYHRKARVWFGDRPARLIDPTDQIGICEAGRIMPARASAAVELLVPRGGDVQYGLLGGTFKATSGTQLVIRTRVSGVQDEPVRKYADALVERLETPVVGLPEQLAVAAVTGIRNRSSVQDALAAGVLTLDCAAYGSISSSPAHFGRLGDALVALLLMPGPSSPSVAAVLEHVFENELYQ